MNKYIWSLIRRITEKRKIGLNFQKPLIYTFQLFCEWHVWEKSIKEISNFLNNLNEIIHLESTHLD